MPTNPVPRPSVGILTFIGLSLTRQRAEGRRPVETDTAGPHGQPSAWPASSSRAMDSAKGLRNR